MEDILQEIGLSQNETRIYLALCEHGRVTISEAAKQAKIHRSNAYDAMEGLMQHGLASFMNIEGNKLYQAADPERLRALLREKGEKLETIIPNLQLMQDLDKAEENSARILRGMPAARRVIDSFLQYDDTIRVMGIQKNVANLLGPFIQHFHKRRQAKGINMQHIYNSDAVERMDLINDMELTEVRVLPDEYDAPISTNIVGDEVTLIDFKKDALIIQIKNKELAQAYKNYFEHLWKAAVPYSEIKRKGNEAKKSPNQ